MNSGANATHWSCKFFCVAPQSISPTSCSTQSKVWAVDEHISMDPGSLDREYSEQIRVKVRYVFYGLLFIDTQHDLKLWNAKGPFFYLRVSQPEAGGGLVQGKRSSPLYPLVNVYITMENHHAIDGKTHYFYGHFLCRFLYVYQAG